MHAKRMVESFARLGAQGYDRFLTEGQAFMGRVNSDSLPTLATWKKRHRPQAGHCYMNAQKFAIGHPDACYFEGYWSSGRVVPVYHGWIVLGDSVVDMTAEACDKKAVALGFDPGQPEENDYFGVHIPTEFVLKCIVTSGQWESLMSFWMNNRMPEPRIRKKRRSKR